MYVKIDQFTGERVGRLRQAPHLYPKTDKFARGAECQRSCFTDWSGGEGRGGMTKTTACVGEHCLRLRLKIFSGKTGFYTQWSWVWRKGAHIKRSAFMCAQLLVFKLHLYGQGPTCSFFPYLAIVWQTGSKRAFQVVLVFLESNHHISRTVRWVDIEVANWHTVGLLTEME